MHKLCKKLSKWLSLLQKNDFSEMELQIRGCKKIAKYLGSLKTSVNFLVTSLQHKEFKIYISLNLHKNVPYFTLGGGEHRGRYEKKQKIWLF